MLSSNQNSVQQSKWKKIAILLNLNKLTSLTYNYLFTKCKQIDIDEDIKNCNNLQDNKSSSFIDFNIFYNINEYFFFNIGIKKTKQYLYPYFSLRYNL